ncbi:MAG TPA: hypothetical protein VNF47_03530 [Streptosporangiaceae bacterium]|nr:hypothetical protein [Streptosporangiaceae bacterium]
MTSARAAVLALLARYIRLSQSEQVSGTADEADQWLESHADQTSARIAAVLSLVNGFASAYGLELLATVHWVLTHETAGDSLDPASMTERVASWSERKGRLFTDVHVRRAMERLQDSAWIPTPTL